MACDIKLPDGTIWAGKHLAVYDGERVIALVAPPDKHTERDDEIAQLLAATPKLLFALLHVRAAYDSAKTDEAFLETLDWKQIDDAIAAAKPPEDFSRN